MRTLAVSDLQRVLRYEPETGKLFWRERPVSMFAHCKYPERARSIWNAKYAGCEAGTDFEGYLSVGLKAFGTGAILAHRVAWAMHYGEWPTAFIDHINRNRRDNRIKNLRDATRLQNQRNLSPSCVNRSGITGVLWDARRMRWRAFIQVKGRQLHLGRHACIGRAITARRAAEQAHDFHETHGKRTA